MNVNRKYIIVFGTLILLLVCITGATTYYKEKGAQIPISTSIPIPEEKEYLIWCYENSIRYDCSNREFFKSGESVAITMNLTQFNNNPYDPYFLCCYTDLKGGLEKQCTPRSISSSVSSVGFTLENVTVPEDKEIFTLIKLTVYPDDSFEEIDEIVIMDLIGKLIK